jgi:hypothetical protein
LFVFLINKLLFCIHLPKTRLKGSLDPPLPFDKAEMTSWSSVEDAIFKKKIKLQELGQLVDDISTSTTLSLEYKCLVSLIAAQTCRVYKAENDPKSCQQFFKTKDKSNKSKHVANFVSNLWIQESLEILQGAATVGNESENMLVISLRYGLRFITSAFVIDNTKKLSVLKEKQNIDWQSLVDKITPLSSAKDLTELGESVKRAKKKFADFLLPKPTGPAATQVGNAVAGKIQRKLSLQEINAKKREERMANMKRKAQGTSIRQASSMASNGGLAGGASAGGTWGAAPASSASSGTWGAATSAPASGGTWGAAASAPASGGTWGATTSAPASTASTPASGGTWGATTSAPTSGGTWGASTTNTPASTTSAPASGGSWGASATSAPTSGGGTWGANTTSKPASTSSTPASGGTWGASTTSAPASSSSTPASGGTWGASAAASTSAPPAGAGTWGASTQTTESSWGASSSATSSNRVGGARGSGSWGNSSSNNVTTSHDNQSVGGRSAAYGGDNGPAGAVSQKDDYLQYQRDKKRPQGRNDNTSNNNKRPRNDQNFAAQPSAGAGRGRGQTLPAWMTQGNSDGLQGGAPPPSSVPPNHNVAPAASRPNQGPPPARGGFSDAGGAGRGRGRGKDMNRPAWMTSGAANDDGPGQPPVAAAASKPNPGPPPVQGGFADTGGAGGGRGRGRGKDMNLPAWMTEKQNS